MPYWLRHMLALAAGMALFALFVWALSAAASFSAGAPHKPAPSYCLDKLTSALSGIPVHNPCNIVFDERSA